MYNFFPYLMPLNMINILTTIERILSLCKGGDY